MSLLVRLVPGLVAAAAALAAMEILSVFGFISPTLRIVAFFSVYIVIAVLVDRAMAAYGASRR